MIFVWLAFSQFEFILHVYKQNLTLISFEY